MVLSTPIRVATTSALLLVGACGSESAPPGVAVSDSAGVTVVSNAIGSVASAARWTLSRQPVVDIGSGPNPAVSLFRVVHALPLDTRRVVIGMTSPPLVVLVDTDGSVATTLGGEGDGPGEFMGVGSVARLAPDSLAVWDPERRRISVFTEDGALQREVDMRDRAPLSWIASPNVSAPSARTYLLPATSTSFVLFAVGMFGPGDGPRRVAIPSTLIDVEGNHLATLGAFPGETTFMSDATGTAPYPLGADTYATAVDNTLIVGTAEEPEYRVYDLDGSLARIVRWADRDRAVQGPLLAEWNDFLEAFLSSMPPPEREGIRDILDAMPQPARFPAYGGLIGSDQGEVWIGPYHPGQLPLGVAYMGRPAVPEHEWLVFAPDGSIRATVLTPPRFRPLAVADNDLWGIHTDELEVESIRAYAIVKE